jgi:DNA-binding transcriptional MerR regulator
MQLLTTSAVANAAGVPEQTVRQLEKRGVIKAQRDSNGRRLFESNTVDAVRKYRRQHPAHGHT